MFANPFSPVFGGKPDCFFGRKDILARFDMAMLDKGSEDRALFITGGRGSGKTALLEQLSRRALESGRRVIDLGAESLISSLVRHLAPYDELTNTISPELEVNVLGSGGRIAGGSASKTVRYDEGDLEIVFLEACKKEQKGIFISIDEIQKASLRDVSLVCGAFQMASRKGYDVMIAIAGLPYAHDEVIHYEGCTYMRRAVHEELGLLQPEEVRSAYLETFARSKGLTLSPDALTLLVTKSLGHPYVMQLLGYYLIAWINGSIQSKCYEVSGSDVEHTALMALAAYERRALKPLVDAMCDEDRRYLLAMASVLDGERVARTAKIAEHLARSPQQASRPRQSLLKNGTIISCGRGELMFNVPYLCQYVMKESTRNANAALVRRWGL